MITIYGKSNCNFCTKAVELVETYKMKYEYKDAEEFENFEELQKRINSHSISTVPQIFWFDKHIGGYQELVSTIENTREFGQDGF
tara:strand:+ start:208 stop:462 length:255 start_codon:yes stop_codon:yes gene_type:complete